MKNNILGRFWLWLKWGSYAHIKRFQFKFIVRGILKTRPVQSMGEDCIILSMISHRDLWMYLVSIKSFIHFFKKGKVVILNDGSLSVKDIHLLRDHIKDVEIIHINNVINDQCPQGGCWERLLLISDLLSHSYVIELDADIITQGNIDEVLDAVRANQSFMMVDSAEKNVKPMEQIHHEANEEPTNRFDNIVERKFHLLSDFQTMKYIRGSGGFCGYPQGAFNRNIVEDFSRRMSKIIGTPWETWGSEKMTTSYLFANHPSHCILPFPKYAVYFCINGINYNAASVLHFIGMNRFKNDLYINCAKSILKVLF